MTHAPTPRHETSAVQTVGSALQPHRPRVLADIDQERMASIALHRGVAAMPVVDAGGRLIGVVGLTAAWSPPS
jgi:Mg/Co/Ni transporter MgtE